MLAVEVFVSAALAIVAALIVLWEVGAFCCGKVGFIAWLQRDRRRLEQYREQGRSHGEAEALARQELDLPPLQKGK